MVNRRRFLSHTCSLGVASATVPSMLAALGWARTAAAQELSDYKALVCILLAGGNDSYNMLVPTDADQYAEYLALRSDLALPLASLLPLPGVTAQGRSLGLHPQMPELHSLYSSGDAAFIANVGTLVEPVVAAEVYNGAQIPLGLYSHSDQIAQWQTARSDERVADGWGGRVADLMQGVNLANGVSMNISLAGSNVFQSGKETVEYAITANDDGAIRIPNYDETSPYGIAKTSAIDDLLASSRADILTREYRQRLVSSIEAGETFIEAMQAGTPFTTEFTPDEFAQSLRQVARVIASRDALGVCRQTFFVQVGGWDHHDEVLDNQARMLPWISGGLAQFRDALVELGIFNDVTTFTISDFGRTLTSNGKGSDHGWGGHHIVMGGSVTGGQIYGDYPLLSPYGPLDIGRGVYVPTTSVDQYFAELALWFGVSRNDLSIVLPNVARFYSPSDPNPPLGFALS